MKAKLEASASSAPGAPFVPPPAEPDNRDVVAIPPADRGSGAVGIVGDGGSLPSRSTTGVNGVPIVGEFATGRLTRSG